MNKNYLTVAQILSFIVGGLILLYVFFISMSAYIFGGGFVVIVFFFMALGGVYIFSGVRLGRAKSNDQMKNEVIGWGVMYLVTSNLIGGIFTILAATSQSKDFTVDGLEGKLKELDNLYDKGLITRDEYQLRRKKIIEEVS